MPSTPVSESLFRLGLNEALPISRDATTSRVVVNNEVLRTVLFTFDAGQELTEHASTTEITNNITYKWYSYKSICQNR